MSILQLAAKRRHQQKAVLSSAAFSLMLIFFIGIYGPATALAASEEDVIAEVARQTSDFRFYGSNGADYPVPGGSFKSYGASGDLGSGWVSFYIDKPVGNTPIQAVIDYHTGQLADDANLNIVPMTGYELGEITHEDYNWGLPNEEVEVWIILPQYLIIVNPFDTGYDQAANLQLSKDYALHLMGGLERAGLLSSSAPNTPMENPAEIDATPAEGAAATGNPLSEPVKISDTMNIMAVHNGPTVPTTLSINTPHLVTEIHDYHWNNAQGATPGTIGLQDQNGKMYGPWQAVGTLGQGGVPNANWFVYPKIVIPAGTYTVIDSDPSTWSQNTDSGGKGMGYVRATPHFETTGGSVDSLDKDNQGSWPAGSGWTESPAGVGAVGNIPGPSNTTEAVTGVVVPGLIAIALGAFGGLGGGGFIPPAGGTPMYPAGGLSPGVPGAGGTHPTAGTVRTGANQEAMHLGRRRGEEEGSIASGIRIDTADMDQGAITISAGDPLIIETPDKEAIYGKPHSGIFIESPVEKLRTIDPESIITNEADNGGIIIDTSAFEDTPPAQTDGAPATGEESGFDQEGYNQEGYDAEGYDRQGFNKEGFDKAGYDAEGYDKEGFNKEGFDRVGYDAEGFDRQGFNLEGFDRAGFDAEGFDKEGFDKDGFNKEGFDRVGYDAEGFDRQGFNLEGFDKAGYDAEGFDKQGFDKAGYDAEGFDKQGFDQEGFDKAGFDAEGFDRQGFDQTGFDKEGFNKDGFDQKGFDREGYNKAGFNAEGFDQEGFDKSGFDKEGFDKAGFDQEGFDKAGYDVEGFDKQGFDQEGFDKAGFDAEGFDKAGFNKEGFDRDGFNPEGFNKAGFDPDGYARNGFNSEGYNREGFDVNGYNAKGFNRSGYNAKGYNAAGYDKEGFNKDGWDKAGYDRSGFNSNGFDREGYDQAGYDKDGYNREGYDREGLEREGYDENGFDKNGYNRNGVDKDGFDREGFDYEGYNRGGYDPWGYNKQGYGKDGYHWSGYDADGYNRDGRHWSENPFEGDGNPFNVAKQDPFGEGEVIAFGTEWKATKPPLGEPYPKTLDKYGAKPWTNEPAPTVPAPEDKGIIGPEEHMDTIKHQGTEKYAPTVPEDKGAIGPEEPTNTIQHQGTDQEAPAVPEGQENAAGHVDQPEQTGDSDTFSYTDPKTGKTSTYEYEKGYTGPRHGDTRTLVGKTDGQTYELEFNAATGKWVNTETGNDFDPEDFERWQNDLAVDKKQAPIGSQKMAAGQSADRQPVDENQAQWKTGDKMQQAADEGSAGTPSGPDDADKVIQNLKKDADNEQGYSRSGFDKDGRDVDGFDIIGLDPQGYDRNGLDLKGFTREQNLSKALDQIIKDKKELNHYVRNPDWHVRKFWNNTFGRFWNEEVGNWKGGQCGEYVEWGTEWLKDDIKHIYGEDVIIDKILIERNDMANHVANLIILPNGERMVVDLWQGIQDGKSQVMAEKDWLKKWDDELGQPVWGANKVTRDYFQDTLLNDIKTAGDTEKGIENFLNYVKKKSPSNYKRAQLIVKSYRKDPWSDSINPSGGEGGKF